MSSVTTTQCMFDMFDGAAAFNQPIGDWDKNGVLALTKALVLSLSALATLVCERGGNLPRLSQDDGVSYLSTAKTRQRETADNIIICVNDFHDQN